jgi:predicted nucleic acid-binding protein
VPRPPPPDRKRSGARAGGEHTVEIIRGVKRLAREERLTVVLTECEASDMPRQEWLEGALSRKPDESSWSSPTWTPPNADSWRIACLMRRHRRRRRTDARAPSERVSALDGGFAATRHLLELQGSMT